MIRYLAYRVGLLIPLLLGAALLIFLAGHYAPGDPVQVLLADHYNPEVAAHKRHELGLDRPLVVQFTAYVVRAAALDFGISYVNPARRVGDVVRQTLPISLRLAALAVAVAAVVGVGLGVWAAVLRRSIVDRLIQVGVIAGLSVPNFVVAAVLVLWFALRWHLFPVAGWGAPANYVLPVAVLAAAPKMLAASGLAKTVRSVCSSTTPVRPAGMVATTSSQPSLSSEVSMRRRRVERTRPRTMRTHSRRKNTSSASAVATWRPTRKARKNDSGFA